MRQLLLNALWWAGAGVLLSLGAAYFVLLGYVIASFTYDKLRGRLK